MTTLRIATFNLENLDASDADGRGPTLDERIAVLRPQLRRLRADVLCLQEVHGQKQATGDYALTALDRLVEGTRYADADRATTDSSDGDPYARRNLVVSSRFPIAGVDQYKHDYAPASSYRTVTADPPETDAGDVTWERPILHVRVDLGNGRLLHVLNLHMKSKQPTRVPGQGGQREDNYRWRSASGWAEGAFLSSMKRVGQALEVRRLVSRSLPSGYRGTEIHNEVLPDESGAFRFDDVFPESDHAPVVAEFELE